MFSFKIINHRIPQKYVHNKLKGQVTEKNESVKVRIVTVLN
jgi:hypothetical protein